MKSITRFTGLLFAAAIMTFAFSSESQAVPAFARQVGVSCNTCHFQHYPALNAFGRAFKASGYTQIGAQAKIEDEGLSLPATLNASVVTKLRIVKNDVSGGPTMGEFQWPDEAALLIGGRASEHVGFLLESALIKGDDPFASYKMPIGFEVGGGHLEIIPYATDGLGAAYSLELLNTGAVRNIRSFENRKAISAHQYIGTAQGAAEGFAFTYANDMGFVNLSLYAPYKGTASVKSLSNYLRAAATPQVAGWDLGVGVQINSGTTEADTGSGYTKYDTESFAIDIQAQGDVGGMPLGVYLTNGNTKGGTTNGNVFNSKTKDKTATALAAELGVAPKVTVGLGFLTGDNGGASDSRFMLGATYMLAQNVQLQLNQTSLGGDANKSPSATSETLLMLFAAF